MVLGFSMVWLLAERIGNRNRFVTFLLATMIYFGLIGVNLLSSGFSKDTIAITYLAVISIPAIIFAFIFAALISAKPFNTTRFIVYVGVALFIVLLIIFSSIIFVFYPASNLSINRRIVELLTAIFFSSLIYYAGLLPFLILLLSNPFWRKRFQKVMYFFALSLPIILSGILSFK